MMLKNENTITIYCDGACSKNPGIGGWGAVLLWQDHTKEISGGEKLTTNNRMELTAAIESLRAVKQAKTLHIYTDSTYVKNGITSWIKNWEKNNWNNGKIKNVDLWKILDEVASKFDIKWHWIKGHSGNKYNERADELARTAILGLKK